MTTLRDKATTKTLHQDGQRFTGDDAQSLVRLPHGLNRQYWAGPRSGVKYELTRTRDGKIFVRYLPSDIAIGDRTGQYLLVGTYPVRDAYSAVERAAKEPGAQSFRVPGGALGVVNDSAPTNVYFAVRGSNHQIEVFAPSARQARRLVSSGAIEPVQ